MRFEVWFWEGQHWQCTPTGIAKETKEASWKVVPNPFTGQNYLGIPGYQFYIVPFFMLGYAWFMVTVVSTVPGCWPFLVSLGLTSRPRSHRRCQRSEDSYDSNLVRCSMTVCDSLKSAQNGLECCYTVQWPRQGRPIELGTCIHQLPYWQSVLFIRAIVFVACSETKVLHTSISLLYSGLTLDKIQKWFCGYCTSIRTFLILFY